MRLCVVAAMRCDVPMPSPRRTGSNEPRRPGCVRVLLHLGNVKMYGVH